MSDRATKEFRVGLAMVAVAALGWFAAIPAGIDLPQSVQFAALSPDFWPRIVMVLLGICGAVVAVQAHVERRAGTASAPAPQDGTSDGTLVEHPLATRIQRVSFAIACLFAFYFAIGYIGIIVSSTLTVLALTVALGQRAWRHVLPLAALLPVVLYYFFVYVAQVPMPLGMFEAWR